MAYHEAHLITFAKPAKRNLRANVIESNATSLISSILTKSLKVRGWEFETDTVRGTDGTFFARRDTDDENTPYVFQMFWSITFNREDGKEPNSNEFAAILRTLAQRSSSPAFGAWTLAEVDGKPYIMPGDDDEISSNINADLIGYADVEVPDEWDKNFAHLYGLDPHIKRIKGAIEAGIMSDWRNRFHCALVGPPGCGKSDISQSIKRALGEDAVMEYDATATTAAGAIKDLSEREILPRVLIVEEIEKADEKALSFLLALCDLRGEIRKTTARNTIQRETKLLVIATVNDVPLFDKLQAGALSSRFANKIWFKRPSRETLAMILTREVAKIDGDPIWIGPTLDYCEDHGISDPRQVIALCLCGREMLVTGEYQKMLADTAEDAS
jgi:hypothetical protein